MRRRDALRVLAGLGALSLVPGAALAKKADRKAETKGDAKSEAKAGGREPAKPSWREGKQLVVVLLQGGPDGLSMAAPTADPLYAVLRPTTALAAEAGTDLGVGCRSRNWLA